MRTGTSIQIDNAPYCCAHPGLCPDTVSIFGSQVVVVGENCMTFDASIEFPAPKIDDLIRDLRKKQAKLADAHAADVEG